MFTNQVISFLLMSLGTGGNLVASHTFTSQKMISPAVRSAYVTPATFPTSRRASDWPFASSSPWNMPLADTATFGPSTSPCNRDITNPAGYIALNSTEWSMPVYKASGSNPSVQLRYFEDNELIKTIKVPTSARPSLPDIFRDDNSDSHLLIINPNRDKVEEMYRARRSGRTTIFVDGTVENNIRGSGIAESGARAYGGSALGGLIRRNEFRDGIHHALAFAIPRSRQKCCSPVWPATSVDDRSSGTYLGNVPMGQLIAIPPSVDIEDLDLSDAGLSLARALQDYGAYDVDSSGGFSFYMESNAAVQEGFSSSGRDLHEDLVKIQPHLRCVTNNREDNVGGGDENASRRAPFAPPFN